MSKIVISIYRLSHFLHKFRLNLFSKFFDYLNRILFGCWIPGSCKIGEKTILGYAGLGIVIHNRAKIGNNCHIDQNVTIGGTSKKYEVPLIGDNVYIGAGAKILGPIKIGNNVVIGANCVVVKDIPEGSLVVGVPGKIIKQGIKKADYV